VSRKPCRNINQLSGGGRIDLTHVEHVVHRDELPALLVDREDRGRRQREFGRARSVVDGEGWQRGRDDGDGRRGLPSPISARVQTSILVCLTVTA